METLWKVLSLSVITVFFGLCNGLPINLENSGPDPHTQLLTGLVAVLLTVCSVVLLAGCLCCQRKNGFQEFRDSPVASSTTIIGSNVDHGHVNPVANSTSEFTIFTPISPPHHNNNVFLANQRIVSCSQEDYRDGDIDASSWFDGSEKDFPRTKLKYIRELGKGWFGRVVEGTSQNISEDQTDNEWTPVVVRILEASATSREKLLFLNDASIYKCGYHPNILKLLGRCLDTVPLLLLQEYCPQGDLKKYLRMCKASQDKLVSEDMPLHWCYQLTLALKHLHDQKLTHPDLAARNCQLSEHLTLKLGDYGLSASYYPEDYYQGSPGVPLRWCAPEIISYTSTTIQTTPTTPEANIWALGVTMWEILEWGEQPYGNLTDDEVISQVLGTSKIRLSRPTYHLIYTDYMYKMMQSCWYSVESRVSISQLDLMMIDLIHVYENTKTSADMSADSSVGGDPISLEDFDSRWNALKPNFTTAENNIYEHSHLNEKKQNQDRGVKSASMNNLHGSLDNLLDNKPFDPMESWLENIASDTSDMSFVRGLNEAITDLDNAIAMENFNSSPEFGKTNIKAGQITSSESETEDENWRKKIERGAYTEKVRQKSRSVADLMVLTHIDCSESDSETLPSLDSKANQRVRYLKYVDSQKKFGSEGNLLNVHDTFEEELKKLQEERRDSLLFVPDKSSECSFSEEKAVTSANAITPTNSRLDSLENSPVKKLMEKLNSPSEMVPPQTVYNVFNVHVQHINVGGTVCDKVSEVHLDVKSSNRTDEKDSTSGITCDKQLESKTSEQEDINSPNFENQSNSSVVRNLNQNEFIDHIKTHSNLITHEKSLDNFHYNSVEKHANGTVHENSDRCSGDIIIKKTYPSNIDMINSNTDASEINSTKTYTPAYQNFTQKNDITGNSKKALNYTSLTAIPNESKEAVSIEEKQFPIDSLKLNSNFDVKIEILNEQNMKNQENNSQNRLSNDVTSKSIADASRENNRNIKLKVPKLSEIIQRNAIDYKVHNHHTSCNNKSTTNDNNEENEKLTHQEIIDKDSGLNTPENSASLEKLYDDNEEILDVGSFDSDRSNDNKITLLTDMPNENECTNLKTNEEISVIAYFEEDHTGHDKEEEIRKIIDFCQKKESKLISSLFLENERLNYLEDLKDFHSKKNKVFDNELLSKLDSDIDKVENYSSFNCDYKTDTLKFLQAEDYHSTNLLPSDLLNKLCKDKFFDNTYNHKIVSNNEHNVNKFEYFTEESLQNSPTSISKLKLPEIKTITLPTAKDLSLNNTLITVSENFCAQKKEDVITNSDINDQITKKDSTCDIKCFTENMQTQISSEANRSNGSSVCDLGDECKNVHKTDASQSEDTAKQINCINFDDALGNDKTQYQTNEYLLKNLPNQYNDNLDKIRTQKNSDETMELSENSTIRIYTEETDDNRNDLFESDEIKLSKSIQDKTRIKMDAFPSGEEVFVDLISIPFQKIDEGEDLTTRDENNYDTVTNDNNFDDCDISLSDKNITKLTQHLNTTKIFLKNELEHYSDSCLVYKYDNVQNENNSTDINDVCISKVLSKDVDNTYFHEINDDEPNVNEESADDIASEIDSSKNSNLEQTQNFILKNNVNQINAHDDPNLIDHIETKTVEDTQSFLSKGVENCIQSKEENVTCHDVTTSENSQYLVLGSMRENNDNQSLIETKTVVEKDDSNNSSFKNISNDITANNSNIERTSIFLKSEIENYSSPERRVDFDVSLTQDKISLNSLTHISTFTSTPFANRRPTDSTVILGASDDYSIDYYSGLKTSVDPENDSDLQFSSNFVHQHNDSNELYSLETWDNFLGRSFDEQESAAMDFNDFSQEPHSLLFLESDGDNNVSVNELQMTKVLNETFDVSKCDIAFNGDGTFVKEVKEENANATFDINTADKEVVQTDEALWKDNRSNNSGGWFLHPQCSTKESQNKETQHQATASNSDESYVGFSMDDEIMAAIRNELLTKLPHAQRASSEHQVDESCEEMDSTEKNEVFLRYNVYNTPLSPIPEESCDSEVGSGRVTPKRINDTSDDEDNSSDWSVQEDNNSSNIHTEDIHSPRAQESPARARPDLHRYTPSQDSCCSNDTLFNIEELNCGANDRILEPIVTLPNQIDPPDSIEEEEETSGSRYDDCNMESHVSESDITLQVNRVEERKESSQIPVIRTEHSYIQEFLDNERYLDINASIDGGEEVSSISDIYLTVSDNTFSFGQNVAPLNSPEDRPWKELQASFRDCDEDQSPKITDYAKEEVSSKIISSNTNNTANTVLNSDSPSSKETFIDNEEPLHYQDDRSPSFANNSAIEEDVDDCFISDEDIDKILREDMESEFTAEHTHDSPHTAENRIYVNMTETEREQCNDGKINDINNQQERNIEYENLKNTFSDEDIYSKIELEESDDKFSRFEDLFGPLTDIRFSGPGSSSQLMTTSFSESNDLGDDQDWDSGSDTRSSSSGEFIWKEGEHEASVKALRAPPQLENANYVTPMENIQEEITPADSSRDNSSSSGSDCEDECPEFVPSAWDKYATPTKSALRSPEKTLERTKEENFKDQQSQKEKKSKGVWFKKQKYHCVYEYPREPESPVLQSYDLWKPTSDYTTMSDWDLDTDPYMPSTLTDSDIYDNPSKHDQISKNLYHLTTFADVNIDTTALDEDFFVSSSSRPFDMLSGLTSQFFPGRQFPESTIWLDNSNITPDSGVEDAPIAANFGNDTLNLFNGQNGGQLTGVQSLKVLAANAVQRGNTKRELGGLRHTRNKLKLDLPPSPSAFTSNKTFSVEPLTEEIVPRQVPTFTTFGKSRFLVQHVDTPPDNERTEKNVSFEALPHRKPQQSQLFLMETDDWKQKKDRQKIESVRGEASLLDSADEDSGIESCTLERKKSNV